MPLKATDLQDRIDTLLQADNFGLSRWIPAFGDAPLQMSYRFETGRAADFPWSDVSDPVAFTTAQKAAVRAALDRYEAVINVTFYEATGPGDADFSFYRAADLYTGSPLSGGGRGRFDFTGDLEWDGSAVFRDVYALDRPEHMDLILHEIGHTLGLKHPGNYDVNSANAPPGPFLPEAEDNEKFTLMSYNDAEDGGPSPMDLRLYDVAALQAWWGVNPGTLAGDTIHRPALSGDLKLVVDSGGTDGLYYGAKAAARLDLREGAFSQLDGQDRLAIAYGSEIENARGGRGHDVLIGNGLGNTLNGKAGRDTLKGGVGQDRIEGKNGNDRLLGGPGRDWLEGGAGFDRVTGGGGADSFRFGAASAKDVVTDFSLGRDSLSLSAALWEGDLDPAEVIARFADVDGGDTVFDFGAGDVLVLRGVSDLSALRDDLELA